MQHRHRCASDRSDQSFRSGNRQLWNQNLCLRTRSQLTRYALCNPGGSSDCSELLLPIIANNTVPCLQPPIDSPVYPLTSHMNTCQACLTALQQPSINMPASFVASPPTFNHENRGGFRHHLLLNQPPGLHSTPLHFLFDQPVDYSNGLYFDHSQNGEALGSSQAGNPFSFPVRLIFFHTLLMHRVHGHIPSSFYS